MRVVYLRSATGDLRWLRSYYGRVFPEGAAKAREAVRRMEDLVAGNPFIGTVTHRPEVRRLRIAHTPFFVLYRPTPERVEVLRVIDSRSLDSMIEE